MFDPAIVISLDIIIFLFCGLLLFVYGGLRFSHPGMFYLFFHGYTVSYRLWNIAAGAPTLFADFRPGVISISWEEIVEAVYLFDIALIIMTLIWVYLNLQNLKTYHKQQKQDDSQPPPKTLSIAHINLVVSFTIPIGVVGLLIFAQTPWTQIDFQSLLGQWSQSSWLVITQTWLGLSMIALIYWHGFRKWYVMVLIAYFALIGIQGIHRFRIIIPCILLCAIYLDRNQRRWPSIRMFLFLGLMGVAFFPLKDLGILVQARSDIESYRNVVSDVFNETISGANGDTMFLDMTASGISLVDNHDSLYWGRTYIALVTLPIPRQLWPEKPGLADHIHEIDRAWRPMARGGMVITYIGESYANFSYIGVIIIPVILAWIIGQAYHTAYRSHYYSTTRFFYLILACNLLQVYRDGLSSIVVFTFVNMMPLVIIWILHWFKPIASQIKPQINLVRMNQSNSSTRI